VRHTIQTTTIARDDKQALYSTQVKGERKVNGQSGKLRLDVFRELHTKETNIDHTSGTFQRAEETKAEAGFVHSSDTKHDSRQEQFAGTDAQVDLATTKHTRGSASAVLRQGAATAKSEALLDATSIEPKQDSLDTAKLHLDAHTEEEVEVAKITATPVINKKGQEVTPPLKSQMVDGRERVFNSATVITVKSTGLTRKSDSTPARSDEVSDDSYDRGPTDVSRQRQMSGLESFTYVKQQQHHRKGLFGILVDTDQTTLTKNRGITEVANLRADQSVGADAAQGAATVAKDDLFVRVQTKTSTKAGWLFNTTTKHVTRSEHKSSDKGYSNDVTTAEDEQNNKKSEENPEISMSAGTTMAASRLAGEVVRKVREIARRVDPETKEWRPWKDLEQAGKDIRDLAGAATEGFVSGHLAAAANAACKASESASGAMKAAAMGGALGTAVSIIKIMTEEEKDDNDGVAKKCKATGAVVRFGHSVYSSGYAKNKALKDVLPAINQAIAKANRKAGGQAAETVLEAAKNKAIAKETSKIANNLQQAVKELSTKMTLKSAKKVFAQRAKAAAGGAALGVAIESGCALIQYKRGKISGREASKRACTSVATNAVGAVATAAAETALIACGVTAGLGAIVVPVVAFG